MNKYHGLGSDREDQRKKVIGWSCSIFLLVSLATLSFAAVKVQEGKAKALPSHIHHGRVSRTLASSKSPKELFHLSLQETIAHARSALALSNDLALSDVQKLQSRKESPVDDCTELLDYSVMQLSDVADPKKRATADDVQTWLSAALTHQETCIDGLANEKSPAAKAMAERVGNLAQLTSKSLALYASMVGRSKSGGGARKLLSSEGFPEWVSAGDRKLLATPVEELRPHAVVAKDGSGTHESIGEALLAVSLADGEGGGGRTVIHLKAGTYSESVSIPSKQKNVMLVGDGKGVTVITGHKSNGGGSSTFGSATFGISGEGFIARDITFVNSAGPGGEQAVALRVGSDRSVIYRCSVQGYQDSLYSLSNRQFYRETDIYGTVDFIFGNAAAVFQACNINAIRGRSGQKNFVTAQGRTDPNQNTGFSIQNCKISGTGESYLGRPWKRYSRVVVMQSSISGIQSAGWYPWSGSFALSSLFYGEYMNSGPSSSTSGRVGWAGYHPSLSPAEASKFTVAGLISGNQWLPSTGVPFDAGL
ncbi:hypothetical protein ACLOJK_000996 [Asimina triloba]